MFWKSKMLNGFPDKGRLQEKWQPNMYDFGFAEGRQVSQVALRVFTCSLRVVCQSHHQVKRTVHGSGAAFISRQGYFRRINQETFLALFVYIPIMLANRVWFGRFAPARRACLGKFSKRVNIWSPWRLWTACMRLE